MHLIIGLVILGFIIMVALTLAELAFTVVVGVIMLPVIGIEFLVRKIRGY